MTISDFVYIIYFPNVAIVYTIIMLIAEHLTQ